MLTGRIELVHNFTGETQYVILVIHKTTAPSTDVICVINGVAGQTRIAYPAPHGQESVLFEDLDPEMYFITAWRSSDGVALDTQINILACDAKSGAIYPITKLEYVVGRGQPNDPADQDTGLRDARLKGKFYWIEERGTGPMLGDAPSAEYVDRSDVGGGWDWVDSAKKFNDLAVYTVFVIERVDIPSSPPTAGGNYRDIFIMSSNFTFDPATHGGKLIVANISALVGTITFPAFATLADFNVKIETHQGTFRNIVLQFAGGNAVMLRRDARNSVIMGIGEELELLLRNNAMYILGHAGADWERIGERIIAPRLGLNALLADGTQYNISDVPRLKWYLDNKANPSEIVSEGIGVGQWGFQFDEGNGKIYFPNKGKYTIDLGAGKIRVPDDRDMVYKALKNTDLSTDLERQSQGVGGYQNYKTSLKGVQLELRDGSGGSSTGTILGTGLSGQDNPGSWRQNESGSLGLGGGSEQWIRIRPAGSDSETYVKSRSLYPQIII